MKAKASKLTPAEAGAAMALTRILKEAATLDKRPIVPVQMTRWTEYTDVQLHPLIERLRLQIIVDPGDPWLIWFLNGNLRLN